MWGNDVTDYNWQLSQLSKVGREAWAMATLERRRAPGDPQEDCKQEAVWLHTLALLTGLHSREAGRSDATAARHDDSVDVVDQCYYWSSLVLLMLGSRCAVVFQGWASKCRSVKVERCRRD